MRSQLLHHLQASIHRLERQAGPAENAADSASTSTGLTELDRLLGGGFAPGTLLEWLAQGEGTGLTSLVLALCRPLLQPPRALILLEPPPSDFRISDFDSRISFYPPALAALGLDLERTIVLRPRNTADTLWACEQSLRCRGVAALVAPLPQLDDRAGRRLKLAAEAGGTRGMLLRSLCVQHEPSWADARLAVRPLPTETKSKSSSGRRWDLQLLRRRRGHGGGTVRMELDDARRLRVVSELAPATPLRRATGA